jgi:hypothetical protein
MSIGDCNEVVYNQIKLKKKFYLKQTGEREARPKLPLLNLPPRLFSLFATPALLNREFVVSSPGTLPLLGLGDTGLMAV